MKPIGSFTPRLAIVALTAACFLFTASPLAASPDWGAIGMETVTLLSRYLQIDTTNPPGNELKAAYFLKGILDRERIESQIFETAPGRGVLLARLKGDGSRKGVVLLNHMDVVPADKRFWSEDPFGGVVKDGYVWGRGALDMKGTGVAQLMAMIQLKRQGIPLKGDVIFLATSDEEAGGFYGVGAFLKEHENLVQNAGVVLNEGGDIAPVGAAGAQGQRKSLWMIDVAEKTPGRVTLTATGIPGHGSMPKPDSAVMQLIDALAKLAHYQPPVQVSPEVREFYVRLAKLSDPGFVETAKNLQTALADPAIAAQFYKNPVNGSRVRNTFSITMLEGSDKINVIPPIARAHLDVRLLPGQNPERFVDELRGVIANDAIKVTWAGAPPGTSSPADHPLFDAARAAAREHDPGATVVPSLLVAATDCLWFRPRGIPCYGFVPFEVMLKDLEGLHGNNERMSVANLTRGPHILFDILRTLVAEPGK